MQKAGIKLVEKIKINKINIEIEWSCLFVGWSLLRVSDGTDHKIAF